MTKRDYKGYKLRKQRKLQVIALKMIMVIVAIFVIGGCVNVIGKAFKEKNKTKQVITIKEDVTELITEDEFQAIEQDIELLPESLKYLYETNEDAREFALEYWKNKDRIWNVDLSEYENTKEVPTLMQWDKRWGYEEYSGDLFGVTGCGPTCLSMAAIYLLQDYSYNPKWMMKFSKRYGYSVEGNGSSWTLISEGGKRLGLSVEELSLSEEVMSSSLSQQSLIIAVLGPGDFTKSGHFIVITDYDKDGFTVKDPNSYINSEKKWAYDELRGQIRNLWRLKND